MPDLVAVLAEPNRRRLLALLGPGEQPVTQLARQFGVTRSAVSQHLGVLADAGLVQVRKEGRFRYYRLDAGGMAKLREALDMFWTNELEQLAAAGPTMRGGRAMAVEKSVLVPLGPNETFAMLTEPERLRRWQTVTARVDLRAGGDYRLRLVAAAEHGDAGPDEWAARSEPLDYLSAAEASLAVCQRVLRATRPEDGSASTPCVKFTVDELADHLFGSIQNLGGCAGAEIADEHDGSQEARIADAAQHALEAWRRRGVEGAVKLGSAEVPATLTAGILSIEFLVHAWDFAGATGQRVVADDALSDFVLDLAHGIIATTMRDGDRFAAEVEVGPDAGAFDRLAAFTGRAPLPTA